jgi:CRP-like cAMP-binding protein
VTRRGQAIAVLPLLDRKPALVLATAVGDARILFVEDEVFNDLMTDNPALTLGIARFLAGEVRRLLMERGRDTAPSYV